MDLILDTCALLSLVGLTDRRLSDRTVEDVAIAGTAYVSACSLFEIALKCKKQNLDLNIFTDAKSFWDTALAEYDLTELPVTHDIFYDAVCLPDHHADPFDRIIIAHARSRRIPVVTFDSRFDDYDVQVIA